MAAPEVWTVRSMLSWCEGYLGRHGDASPRRSAEVLVGKACGLERLQLYLDLDRPLSPDELDVMREDVRKRAAGMPLQYITGTAPFRYLEVKVAPGVLIPRPETEVLVSEALSLLPPAPKPQDAYDKVLLAALRAQERAEAETGDAGGLGMQDASADADVADSAVEADGGREAGDMRAVAGEADLAAAPVAGIAALFPDAGDEALLVADICTGTGCIACSIATEHPNARVVATDLSPQAVALARENVEAFGVGDRVQVVECDLGTGIPADAMGSFDLVVSNPPYVPTGVLAGIPGEVRDFEPELALDGGEDGLDLYRRLLVWAHDALKPGGGFACELHETCLESASQLAAAAGFASTRVVDDLAGRPRVLVACKPQGDAGVAQAIAAPAACQG